MNTGASKTERWGLVVAVGLALAAVTDAQPATRRATNLTTLLAYPGFYHARPIVIVGKVGVEKDELRLSDDNASIHLIFKGNAPDGLDEVRGEFWDLGRMKADDIRLSTYDLRQTFKIDPNAPWPRPGEVTAIIATAVAPAVVPNQPSIRAIELNPSRYLDQKVAITGQFSGRNLLGEMPDAPGKSRYDFVLRSTDAAIWVTNMRPKLKDTNGKEFELGLDARIDTGRWLTLRGTVQQARGLLLVDAEAGSLALTKPPVETHTEEEPIRVPAGPPPEVVFSAPTEDETDVLTSTTVRIQFSRDLDQSTLKGRIKPHYQASQSAAPGEPVAPPVEFTFQYSAANRVLEIKFTKPLERFRTLKVDLVEGIVGTDGQSLKPWTLTFMLGGS
ncbi:MAG TPA: Ig-like domain-containing protein [Vicinamibacterales bacterium]|nr:Ig-like domain-containing protein [Vicinamibacterales bacterium]